MDIARPAGSRPGCCSGSAVTRLLRIRSLYYELVAVAILGFAGTGIPLFGSLYFERVWHQDTGPAAATSTPSSAWRAFLGLPVAYVLGDRLFRRAPAGAARSWPRVCITAYGGLFAVSLYMPELWMVVALQFLANAAVAPLAISHLPDPGRHRPARDAHDLLRHVRGVRAGVRRLRRRRSSSGPSATPPA